MLRGEFAAGTGRSYMRGQLWLPRFDLRGEIRFCVDTAAGYTTLMPRDALNLGVDYAELAEAIDLATVGGTTHTFLEPAEVTFVDSESRPAFSFRTMLALPARSADTAAVPSLLGRDVINRWRIDYHPSSGQLVCEVIAADETIALPL